MKHLKLLIASLMIVGSGAFAHAQVSSEDDLYAPEDSWEDENYESYNYDTDELFMYESYEGESSYPYEEEEYYDYEAPEEYFPLDDETVESEDIWY